MKIFFHTFYRAKFQRELRRIRREVENEINKLEQEEQTRHLAALLEHTRATV